MLGKLLWTGSDSFSATERKFVEQLIVENAQMLTKNWSLDIESESGQSACIAFLNVLEVVATILQAERAPREYRRAFTGNYQKLFPDEARRYSVVILQASMQQHLFIWVNGCKFEFSAETGRRASVLQHTWNKICMLQLQWAEPCATRPCRSEFRGALEELDRSWAGFECQYITELIGIEEKARRLLVKAIQHEKNMRLLGPPAALCNDLEYEEEKRKLVICVGHLNSVANFQRKGRNDLRVDILDDAIATLRRCDAAEECQSMSIAAIDAARCLAKHVVDSFTAVREYLREVEHCLERVDAHLCNNVGLVAKLVDWEESWEVGARFFQRLPLLDAVCYLVAEIRAVQHVAPAFRAMCEEFDVELFLVLPRIIWTCFLDQPAKYTELLRNLAPHHFLGKPMTNCERPGEKMNGLIDKYKQVKSLLVGAHDACAVRSPVTASWELLAKRVLAGSHEVKDDTYGQLTLYWRSSAQSAVENFMSELEGWSIDLQRHAPEDWNQWCAILVRCLSGSQKIQQTAFQV